MAETKTTTTYHNINQNSTSKTKVQLSSNSPIKIISSLKSKNVVNSSVGKKPVITATLNHVATSINSGIIGSTGSTGNTGNIEKITTIFKGKETITNSINKINHSSTPSAGINNIL